MLSANHLRAFANTVTKFATVGGMAIDSVNGVLTTRVVPVQGKQLGHFAEKPGLESLNSWELPESSSPGLQVLKDAAKLLRESNIPVAFPTETVYGLGADATRSEAVKGIYRAKGRPSDNPLIIHVCDMNMLRDLLLNKQSDDRSGKDPIPAIYKPLIERFWPGPLTILLPDSDPSILAPEVTAGLKTFGARMPDSPLALSLIKLAGVPVAAPSANASTKPSTTTADHVLHDLDGRIEMILDGGPCEVGVESTIVDGLCSPPVILRPGGISINSIRECTGWEKVEVAYKDQTENDGDAPRAPGMKYKHYSPKAKVILAENGADIVPKDLLDFRIELGDADEASFLDFSGLPYIDLRNGLFKLPVIGIVRTRHWAPWGGFDQSSWTHVVPKPPNSAAADNAAPPSSNGTSHIAKNLREGHIYSHSSDSSDDDDDDNDDDDSESPLLVAKIVEIALGSDAKAIAHGLFSALRELDKRNADVIYVEGVEDDDRRPVRDADAVRSPDRGGGDGDGGIAAAIMNRLRKAATFVKS